MIQKGKRIKERRRVIKQNGEVRKRNSKLKTRFRHEYIILGPNNLLNPYWQQFLEYRIIKKDVFRGEKVLVVEAKPRSNIEIGHIWGNIWIREKDFAILKIQWDQRSIRNFQSVPQIFLNLNALPKLSCYTEYGIEKNGIRFPNELVIEESYVNKEMNETFCKSKTIVTYQNYHFFNVTTEVRIQKSALGGAPSKNIKL